MIKLDIQAIKAQQTTSQAQNQAAHAAIRQHLQAIEKTSLEYAKQGKKMPVIVAQG